MSVSLFIGIVLSFVGAMVAHEFWISYRRWDEKRQRDEVYRQQDRAWKASGLDKEMDPRDLCPLNFQHESLQKVEKLVLDEPEVCLEVIVRRMGSKQPRPFEEQELREPLEEGPFWRGLLSAI